MTKPGLKQETRARVVKNLKLINHDFVNEVSVLLMSDSGIDEEFVKSTINHMQRLVELVDKE